MTEYASAFSGTAYYYGRYRHRYPPAMVETIRDRLELDGKGRFFDAGCGTGNLTLPLAPYFEETIGVDISGDMIDEARRRATGLPGISFTVGDASLISPEAGKFRLIASGEAFHWMDREKAIRSWYDALQPGGGVVLAGTGGGSMQGTDPWRIALWDTIHRWLGPGRRNAGWENKMTRRHEEIVGDMPFEWIEQHVFERVEVRDIDSIIGFLYSTSFCNRSLLGKKAEAFEDDLRQTLLAVDPLGKFEERLKADCIIAKKRA